MPTSQLSIGAIRTSSLAASNRMPTKTSLASQGRQAGAQIQQQVEAASRPWSSGRSLRQARAWEQMYLVKTRWLGQITRPIRTRGRLASTSSQWVVIPELMPIILWRAPTLPMWLAATNFSQQTRIRIYSDSTAVWPRMTANQPRKSWTWASEPQPPRARTAFKPIR